MLLDTTKSKIYSMKYHPHTNCIWLKHFSNILDIQHDAKIHNYQKQQGKSDILEKLMKFNATRIVF